MPLEIVAAFSVDAVTKTDGWSRFWFGYLWTHFKYSVVAVIKKHFPAPALPLKNIWNGLSGNSLFFSANLQCNT